MRVFLLFFSFVLFVSCDYFSSSKNRNAQPLDTIVDFTKVDVSPSFKMCDKLIDDAKTKCFRANIHQQLTKNFKQIELTTEEDFNELINVNLLIDKQGEVSLKEITTSDLLQKLLPDLEVCIEKSISSLPKLSPAIKRGIPVTTQYKLPIKIKTK